MSDLTELFLFTKSYFQSIDRGKNDELNTFSFKIWDIIVYKFIRKTNIRDGFERIPPKERKGQIEKNAINKYILVINLLRCMGAERVWFCTFGRTLRML